MTPNTTYPVHRECAKCKSNKGTKLAIGPNGHRTLVCEDCWNKMDFTYTSPHRILYKCVVCNRVYSKLPESEFKGVDGCCRPGSFIEVDQLEATKTILEETLPKMIKDGDSKI